MNNSFEPFKFDLKKAQSLVDEAIEQKGENFVYQRRVGNECLYVHRGVRWAEDVQDYVNSDDTTPGCIWGHALIGAGVPDRRFDALEGDDIGSVVESLVRTGDLTDADPLATAWAAAVQSKQDKGMSWADARDYANTLLRDSERFTNHEDARPQWILNNV